MLKASALRADGPRFAPGSRHTSDFERWDFNDYLDMHLVIRLSVRTGWPDVSIASDGEFDLHHLRQCDISSQRPTLPFVGTVTGQGNKRTHVREYCLLLALRSSNMLVSLRDGSAQAIVRIS